MDSSVIAGLMGGTLGVVMVNAVARRVGRSAAPGDLRFGWAMWCLGVCAALFSLGLLVLFVTTRSAQEPWAVVGLVGGFGLMAVYCLGDAAFVRGSYDNLGIEFSTSWPCGTSTARQTLLQRPTAWSPQATGVCPLLAGAHCPKSHIDPPQRPYLPHPDGHSTPATASPSDPSNSGFGSAQQPVQAVWTALCGI